MNGSGQEPLELEGELRVSTDGDVCIGHHDLGREIWDWCNGYYPRVRVLIVPLDEE